jgi:branched-chain amino acid transport system ATP-binding protein
VAEGLILDVQDLNSGYGRSQVLFGFSVQVPLCGAVSIVGRNGAGKTTLLRTIMGELPTISGRVHLNGIDVTKSTTEQRARAGIGYVPQEQSVFARLSVLENLQVGAISAGRNHRDLDRALQVFPKLGHRLKQTAGTMSGGERKMLAIGRALLGEPRVLLLDEPTEGVWIGVVEEIAETLTSLAKEIGIILVEQHLDLALRVAGRTYVMDRGTVALEGVSNEVRKSPKLMKYLSP